MASPRPSPSNGLLQTARRKILTVVLLVGTIWVVFLTSVILSLAYQIDLNQFGLAPRTLRGAIGIVTMPFLHASLLHLVRNTFSLAILLTILVVTKNRPWQIFAALVLVGGLLLWTLGRGGLHPHVGASGLIYAMVTFLIVTGFMEKRLGALLVSFVVGFLYGGSLLWSVLPGLNSDISWEGHLYGALGGILVAYTMHLFRRERELLPSS